MTETKARRRRPAHKQTCTLPSEREGRGGLRPSKVAQGESLSLRMKSKPTQPFTHKLRRSERRKELSDCGLWRVLLPFPFLASQPAQLLSTLRDRHHCPTIIKFFSSPLWYSGLATAIADFTINPIIRMTVYIREREGAWKLPHKTQQRQKSIEAAEDEGIEQRMERTRRKKAKGKEEKEQHTLYTLAA